VNEDQIGRLLRAAWNEQPPDDLEQIIAEARRREQLATQSLPLAARLAIFLLPPVTRARFAQEWAAELDTLARVDRGRLRPMRRLASVRLLLGAPRLALVLRSRVPKGSAVSERLCVFAFAVATVAVMLSVVAVISLDGRSTINDLIAGVWGIVFVVPAVAEAVHRVCSHRADESKHESEPQ
jgi:hypothetical protein